MKKIFFRLMMLCMTALVLPIATSCSDDDDDMTPNIPEQPTPSNTVYITNGTGSISFQRFRVAFLTANGETLTNKEYGTVNVGESITATIPTGATQYYMGTVLNGKYFFSPNYPVSITNIKVSYDELMEWRANN
ncbi:MAG: hypothetical protein J6K41_12560 [Paraprevotella sp.]|jgi:lipoprotein|nr:hypothetical protein [Paraprevotella sp.]